jgi:O-antigen ligase
VAPSKKEKVKKDLASPQPSETHRNSANAGTRPSKRRRAMAVPEMPPEHAELPASTAPATRQRKARANGAAARRDAKASFTAIQEESNRHVAPEALEADGAQHDAMISELPTVLDTTIEQSEATAAHRDSTAGRRHRPDSAVVESTDFVVSSAGVAALAMPMLRLPQAPAWIRRINWRSTTTFLLILAATIASGIGIAYVAASYKPLIAAALIVGVAVGIRCITQPFFALMLTMIFIPMDALDDYFPPSLSAVKLMSLVTIGCFVVYWLAFSENRRLLRGTMPKIILLFLALGLIGTFFAYYPDNSLDAVFRFFRLFLLTLLIQNLVDTPKRARLLILALMIAVCISAAVGLEALLTTHLKNYRPVGLTQQPNKFGNDTAQMVPLAIAFLWSARSRTARLLYAAAAGLLVTGVVISLSRGSLIAMLAVLPLLLWRLGGKHRIQIFAGIAIALIVAFPFIPPRFYDRFSTLSDPNEDFSVMRRQTYLAFAQKKFMEHPFVGIGLKNFEQLYAQSEYRILLDEGDKVKGRPAHNMYVHLSVETGILGIGLFASMIIWAWYDLRRSQKGFAAQGDIYSLRLAQGLETSFICFLILCLFGSRQYEEFPWMIFALSSALVRLSRVRSESLAQGDQHENTQIAAAPVAGHPAGAS